MYGKVWRGTLDQSRAVAIKAAVPVSNEELEARIAQMQEDGELPDEFDDDDRPMLKSMLEDERIQQLLNEIDALTHIGSHPHIIAYVGSQLFKRKLYVLTELQDGNIRELLSAAAAFDQLGPTAAKPAARPLVAKLAREPAFRLDWCCQLAHAVAYLHEISWIHADIKPENILYSASSETIRLGDFGFAQQIASAEDARRFGAQRKGSALYMGPEAYHAIYHGPESDVYAAGITIWEIMTLQDAFADILSDVSVMDEIMALTDELEACLRPPLDALHPELVDSLYTVRADGDHLRSVWHPLYDRRLSAAEVRQNLLAHVNAVNPQVGTST
jgi:serine/threonine protein kinase